MPNTRTREIEWLTAYDSYYYDRAAERPLPVLRVKYAMLPAVADFAARDGGLIQRETARAAASGGCITACTASIFQASIRRVGLEHHYCQPVHRRPSPQHDVRYRGLAILTEVIH
jgi:hypothetical protein